jgi:outer membrane protein assembly factor BamD (BamD/ComL family)
MKPFRHYFFVIFAAGLMTTSVLFAEEIQSVSQQVLDLQKAARDNVANKDIGQAIGYYEQVVQAAPKTSYALDAQAQIVCLCIQDKKTQAADAALDTLMAQCSDSPAFVYALNAVASGYMLKVKCQKLKIRKRVQVQPG